MARVPFKTLARYTGEGALCGLLAWAVTDVTSDAVLYLVCKRLALEVAATNPQLQEELGAPFSAGPWYNSSVGLKQRGLIATCSFPLKGTKAGSEIYLRAIRKEGYWSTLLYNLIGPCEWDLVSLEAVLPAGGGRSRNVSLLDPDVVPGASSKTDVADVTGKGHHAALPAVVGGKAESNSGPSTDKAEPLAKNGNL